MGKKKNKKKKINLKEIATEDIAMTMKALLDYNTILIKDIERQVMKLSSILNIELDDLELKKKERPLSILESQELATRTEVLLKDFNKRVKAKLKSQKG